MKLTKVDASWLLRPVKLDVTLLFRSLSLSLDLMISSITLNPINGTSRASSVTRNGTVSSFEEDSSLNFSSTHPLYGISLPLAAVLNSNSREVSLNECFRDYRYLGSGVPQNIYLAVINGPFNSTFVSNQTYNSGLLLRCQMAYKNSTLRIQIIRFLPI